MKNIFEKEISNQVINRINDLTENSKPTWGEMSVAQMLAHCCVTYEFIYDNKHVKPNLIKKTILRWLIKGIVVNDKPYKKNSRTAPDFLIKETKEFEYEKKRLIDYLNKTQQLGEKYFDNKESHSFGKLTSTEWSNMFYKHLDHHLRQFNV